ncbi:MAG: TRAP transporter permease [Rhodospirillaceae bacterium]|nr:TRAP transporter permease [Rhodospirillaceae bacterium]
MTQPTEAAQPDVSKYEPELQFRPVSRATAWITGGLLIALSLFHYYSAWSSLVPQLMFRGIHLAFVLGLIFLLFGLCPVRSSLVPEHRSPWLYPGGMPLTDWVLALAVAAAALYLPLLPTDEVARRVGNPSETDVVMGTLLIVLVLEATRRAMGWTLPAIALLFICYGLFGRYAPGVLAHPGASWAGVVNHLYMTDQGIYGIAVGVVAQYVFLFVVFGVLATRIGLGQLFIDIAYCIAGRYAGGPAKVAVFSSAMLGMISGSSIANTVTTGSLTIPAMKKVGYPPHFAGAVEATASTGGQITPPIMGAAAFIMVEFLEIPYRDILVAALVPAMLHYFGVVVMVHLEAKRLGLRGLRPDEMPKILLVLRDHWPTLIPLGILIWMILQGRSPDNAAFWGLTACGVVGFLNISDVFSLRRTLDFFRQGDLRGLIAYLIFCFRTSQTRIRLPDLAAALQTGAKYALAVGAAAASVGIIVGIVTLTGTGFRLSFMVTQAAQNLGEFVVGAVPWGVVSVAGLTLFFTLVFTAIACIIMGAGIPTTATYIILTTIAAPALASPLLGEHAVAPVVSHFFVFYYGVLADITPPVALAAYAAAGIAGSNPFRTGNTAFRLAIAKALVPFVFVYSPSLLIITDGFTWQAFIITLVGAVAGITLLGGAFSAYLLRPLRIWERWLLAVAALPLISPGLASMAVGAAIAAPVLVLQMLRRKGPEGA